MQDLKVNVVIGTDDSVIITSFAVVESLIKYFSLLLYNIMDNREYMLLINYIGIV